jgi:DNA-binding transcriptional regulator GbsR (MarR family)
VEDWIQEEIDAYQKELDRLNAEQNKRLPFCTLDKSIKSILWQLAEEKEREREAKEILDWVSGLFN